MPPRDEHAVHDNSVQHGAEKRPAVSKRFMFIDASNGGVNAKPDKEVRSFVMKSARKRKPWSTQAKLPKAESPAATQFRSSPGKDADESARSDLSTHEHDHKGSVRVWDSHSMPSLASSRSGSISSSSNGRKGSLPNHTSPSTAFEYLGEVQRFRSRFRSRSRRRRSAALSQRDGFDIRFKASLDCLAVRLDASAQGLLHQFIEKLIPRMIPLDVHGSASVTAARWASDCMQSPLGAAFIYTALHSSARLTNIDPEAFKWRAVSEVNKLLSSPATSTADVLIATVLMLLAHEELDLADVSRRSEDRKWRMSAKEAHLNGLKTMIWQRGGLRALGGNRCLQVFILMHSMARCIATFKQPYAVLFNGDGQIEDYPGSSPISTWPAMQSFLYLNVHPLLLRIMSSMSTFSTDLTTWYTNRPETSHDDAAMELQKHSCLLMYRLFDFYQQGEENEASGRRGRSAINQSICLALVVFVISATEPDVFSFGPRLSQAAAKLRTALERIPITDWADAPSLLLWIVTMAALSAKGIAKSQRDGESDYSFIMRYSRSAFIGGSSGAMAEIEEPLRMVQTWPWVFCVFDARAKRLWSKMGLCGVEAVEVEESSSDDEELVDEEDAVGRSTAQRFFAAKIACS